MSESFDNRFEELMNSQQTKINENLDKNQGKVTISSPPKELK